MLYIKICKEKRNMSELLKENLSNENSEQILDYCKSEFIKEIGGGLNSQLDAVLEHVISIRDKTTNIFEQKMFEDIHKALSSRRFEFNNEFRAFLETSFNKVKDDNNEENGIVKKGFAILKKESPENFKKDSEKISKLSLLSAEEEEKNVIKQSLENKLKIVLGEELDALSARVKQLEKELLIAKNMRPKKRFDDNTEDKNFFSPEILSQALNYSLNKIFQDHSLQKQVMNMFVLYWPNTIRQAYSGINHYLVSRDVMPNYYGKIKHGETPTQLSNLDIERRIENIANQLNLPPLPELTGQPILVPVSHLNQLNALNSMNQLGQLGQMSSMPMDNQNMTMMPISVDSNQQNINLSSGSDDTSNQQKQLNNTKENLNKSSQVFDFSNNQIVSSVQHNMPYNNNVEVSRHVVQSFYDILSDVKSKINSNQMSSPAYLRQPKELEEQSFLNAGLMQSLGLMKKDSNPLIQKTESRTRLSTDDNHQSDASGFLGGANRHVASRRNSVTLSNDQVMKSINQLQQQFLHLNMTNALLPSIANQLNQATNQKNVISEISKTTNEMIKKVEEMSKEMNKNLNQKISPEMSEKDREDIYQKEIQLIKDKKEEEDKLRIDQVIIDLLDLMFEKIFSNQNLPENIKYLIGKLQIPILKHSLQDKTFFMNKDNSVRIFLDCLSSEETLFNTEYHAKFEKIIDNILLADEFNNELFEKSLNDIQEMLKNYQNKETNLIKVVEKDISQIEKISSHYENVLSFVNKYTKKANYAPVKSFIEDIWVKAFVERWSSEVKEDTTDIVRDLSPEGKISLNQTLIVFEMMIWSTNMTENNEELIKKLRSFVPKMTEGLRRICIDLKIDKNDLQNLTFLMAQKQIHFIRNAISNLPNEQKILQQTSAYQENNERKLKDLKENEDKLVRSFESKIDSIKQIHKVEKEIKNVKSDFDTIFIKGRWFEMGHGKTKIRLLWVSPKASIFLFSNPETKKVYKFDKAKVWAYFKSEHIKPIQIQTDEINSSNFIFDAVQALKDKFAF